MYLNALESWRVERVTNSRLGEWQKRFPGGTSSAFGEGAYGHPGSSS